MQEAKVVTNSYGAAEPGVGGGVLSIVTKTGGNTFHGSVFEFFRDGRLNARSFFDEQKPNLRRHQFGMAAGGRLVRDRTFFFATAERLDERMGIGRVTTVPSLAAREGRLPDPVRPGWTIPVHPAVQPFLALFPLPNGQDFGDGLAEHSFESEQRANETLGQIRVDHALTASQRLFVRYTRTTGTKHEPWHFPGFGIDWQGRNHFLTVEDRLALGSTLAGTLRFAYGGTNVMQTDEVGGRVFEHLAIIPGRPMPQLAIGGMPNVGALPSSLNRAVQHHFSWSGDMSLLRSGHLLKWGGAVERFNVLSHFGFFWAGRFNFAGIEQFLRGQPSTLLAALPGADPVRELSTLQFSAYVQDEIVVTPALSLNLGLRWDVATRAHRQRGAPRQSARSDDRLGADDPSPVANPEAEPCAARRVLVVSRIGSGRS